MQIATLHPDRLVSLLAAVIAAGVLAVAPVRAADWMAANPKASLRDFHDAFLSYSGPLPLVRKMMPGNDSPPLQGFGDRGLSELR